LQLNPQTVERVISDALAEDLGGGDITSRAVIPPGARFSGVLSARQALVVAGLDLAGLVFARLAPGLVWEPLAAEGDLCPAGAVLARLEGPARELLTAERTALNLMQHLAGIATLTHAYAEAIRRAAGDNGPALLDTRKTIPGLRELAKYATALGGAQNHRLRLDDGVLIKDNHLAVAGSVSEAVARARAAGLHDIEVECDSLAQVAEALAAGAPRLLLDNMDNGTLRQAVEMARGRAKTEASGGVNLDTIEGIAQTGVDYISVGRITQSAPAVDIGLDWTTLDRPAGA
jgi:nicotinate-nucleotide pyrophosphorylase (carboxylating)